MINIRPLGLSLSLIGAVCQAAAATGPFMHTPVNIEMLPFDSGKNILDDIIDLKLNHFNLKLNHSMTRPEDVILLYPVSQGATGGNVDEDGQEPQGVSGLMSASMMSSINLNPLGAGLDEETQRAIEFSASDRLEIDPVIYPHFHRLVLLGGDLTQITGELCPALMSDINRLIENILKKEGTTLEELKFNHLLFRWLRWLKGSNIIHTLNRIYLTSTHREQPEDFNFTMLMVTYSDLGSMIRFYNALSNINMGDVAFSDVVRNFLSQMVVGSMPSEESGIIPIMEQPVTILVTAIVYQSSLIEALINGRNITFNLSEFSENRELYAERYQHLVPSLSNAISQLLVTDEKDGNRETPKSRRCALAIIHILLNETGLMSQLSSGQYRVGSQPLATVEAISPGLLAILNNFAGQSSQARAQSVAVIIAMLNMPYLVGMLNRIEGSESHNLQRVFTWISERYTTIVNNTQDEWSQLILEAAIESIAHPSEVSHNNSDSINQLVTGWVSTIQKETLADADGFEVTDIEEHTVRVVPGAVVSALIRLHPSMSQFSNKETSDIKGEMKRLMRKK
ncbi:hypothetical protein [Endozoicomonas lisbonensis]|uniref:Uncharacterized protein n=1 Tax=Endozoicomonas lisbonensis TaxID=3120522 RepID=A0ABV2SB84_9GAMM